MKPVKRRQRRRPVRFAKKWIYQRVCAAKMNPKTLLFVFGCQRSGTSMFTQLFQNDLSSKVYGERRLAGSSGFRLLPLEEIRELTQRERAGLLVSKPLVESQNAARILQFFGEARAIWMFRSYAGVANSSRVRFSRETAMRNLRPLVDQTAKKTFASENASTETKALVADYFSDDMKGDDAQILYWYVRNALYYDQALDTHTRVRLCRYEDLVERPADVMHDVYDFLGRPFPGDKMVAGVHRRSVDRTIQLDATPELLAICDALQERLIGSMHHTQ